MDQKGEDKLKKVKTKNKITIGLSKKDRKLLSKKKHSLLMTRGVPGTHDVDLMLNFFKKIKAKNFKRLQVPAFNKAIDDRYPKNLWHRIKKNLML